MAEQNFLAAEFEAHRPQLRRVAYRMLGSINDADDAVQEAWLRLSRNDAGPIENLGGWLTTVVARVCLDMLRSAKARREVASDWTQAERAPGQDSGGAAWEQEEMLADSVGLALLVVLKTLAPAERVAFVLHDMFDLPFEQIAPIVGRTPAASRQLASRARRRVQGLKPEVDADLGRQQEIVEAFLAASRGGDFQALLTVLDPDVVYCADPAAVQMGSPAEARGAAAVAETFKGKAKAAKPALVDGTVGVVVPIRGQVRVVLLIRLTNDRIAEIRAIADPAQLRHLDLTPLSA